MYSLSGWYYNSGGKWFWVTVKTSNGSPVDVWLERIASPDIQIAFKDPEASQQRFHYPDTM